MKKSTYIFLTGILAVLTLMLGCQPISLVPEFVPNGFLQEEYSFGDYVVRMYQREEIIYQVDAASFEIIWNGCRVYAVHGHSFQIINFPKDSKTNSCNSISSDITGNGKPNLVMSEWTGHAHCCTFYHIFEIGNKFRHIQTIDLKHSEWAAFENFDSDPDLELSMSDWTFAYWRTCFANSPSFEVILKYTGNKYEMACELMRKPGLPHNELIQLATAIRCSPAWKQEQPPVELWERMLKLIYTGNMNQAWLLVKLSWPHGIAGKDKFVKDFALNLAKSPFWKGILKLNHKQM